MKGTYLNNIDFKHLKRCVAFAQAYYLLSSFIQQANVMETQLILFHARDYICEMFANETRRYIKRNNFDFNDLDKSKEFERNLKRNL